MGVSPPKPNQLPTEQQKPSARSNTFGAPSEEASDELDASGFGNNALDRDERVELILWYRLSSAADQVAASNLQPIYSVDARLRPAAGSSSQLHTQWDRHSPGPSVSNDGAPMVEVQFEPEVTSRRVDWSEPAGLLLNNVMSPSAKHYATSQMSNRVRLEIELAAKSFASDKQLAGSNPMANLIIDKVKADDAGLYKCRVDFKFGRTRYQLIKLDVIGKLRTANIANYREMWCK